MLSAKLLKVIFDSTSIWSREQLASGLQSLLVNPAMNWFNLSIVVEDEKQYKNKLTSAELNMWFCRICWTIEKRLI
ncbi:portal protein [Candidatus Tisiphia endosymbiont of Parasteatoda lunata]|uniref:portal protein n=1 Tax=Candidatus Tisiphia endosymbiont of Parasteatoda lunata TaxID=3066275 RepID=UPI00313B18EC